MRTCLALIRVVYHYSLIGGYLRTRRRCSFDLYRDNRGTIMCELTKAHMISFHDSRLSLTSHAKSIAWPAT